MQTQQIKLSELEPNPFQYRRVFPQAEMDELADSIKENGVLQAILVRPVSKKTNLKTKFQIIAGERRYRAALAVGLKTIPATIRVMDDLEAISVALIENLQRENPDDWATATGIKSMMEMSAAQGEPLSELAVARKLKKSTGFVRNHLGLFKLRPQLQEVAQQHSNVKSSLFEIEKVKDPETEQQLIEAVRSGAPFQAIKSRVDQHLTHQKWLSESRAIDPETGRRAGEFARNGGGNVSRGLMVTGVSVSEANKSLQAVTQETEWKIDTIEKWLKKASPSQRRKLASKFIELAKRLERFAE